MQALNNFFEEVSARMENPLESLARLVKDVENVQIDQKRFNKVQQKLSGMPAQGNQNSPQLHQQKQGVHVAAQIVDKDRVWDRMTFGDFVNRSVQAITQRQSQAVEEVVENLSAVQAVQPNQNISELHAQRIKNKQQLQQQQGDDVAPVRQFQSDDKKALKKVDGESDRNPMTLGDFFSRSVQTIAQKQYQAVEQVIENLEIIQINESNHSQPQLKIQKHQQQLPGEQLQQLNRRAKAQAAESLTKKNETLEPSQLSQQVDNNFSFADSLSPSIVQQAQQYCQSLRQHYFNQNLYTQATLTAFIHQISQTQKNNSYRCLQQSFQLLKQLFFTNQNNNSTKNQSKSVRKNPSTRKLESTQFNLQLTMRSKLSKQSGTHIDRQDSLVYSNATSFGVNLKSKQVSRHNSSTRLVRPHEELDEIIHIQKTSSKGEVENNTESEFEAKSLSDTEPLKNIPKNKRSKNSANRSQQQSVRSKSSRNPMAPSFNNDFITDRTIQPTTLIHQQHDYQILPLTQQPLPHHQPSTKKANINTFGIQTPQIPIKKSFSIKTYSNNKTQNSRTTQKRSEEASVFSAEISQLQSRISKIKETKLLKKMRLEEELRKVNMEIQQLKIQQQEQQENTRQSHAKHKSSYVSSKQKSAYQSRLQINDDQQQKKKAVNLVKSLRQQKMSRQNHKRDQHKAFNADLHQQMQDIMKIKYFNQQRIKQKRQLEIIERMKQQEMRKIVEQKQKQQSVEFLAKLKNGAAVGESKIERVDRFESKVRLNSKKTQESPVKRTQDREIIEPMSNPALEKKRQYMKKMRNFTIIKKDREDLYEQALN